MLQAQAMDILKESGLNQELHSAACNFTKKPGQIYHLYQRASGQNYFSMLSPEVRFVFKDLWKKHSNILYYYIVGMESIG